MMTPLLAGRWLAVCVAAAVLLCATRAVLAADAAAPVAGQGAASGTAVAAPPAVHGEYDSQPLTAARPSAATGQSATNASGPAAGVGGLDLPRICYSLALVLGLVLLLRWGARWFLPGAALVRRSAAVRLLERTPLGPKQQVLLVAVGRRVIVVGDNGQQMTRLCEITDVEEVAGLMADIATVRAAPEIEKDHDEAESAFANELTEAQTRREAVAEETAVAAPVAVAPVAVVPAAVAPVVVAPVAAVSEGPSVAPVTDRAAAALAARLFDRLRARQAGGGNVAAKAAEGQPTLFEQSGGKTSDAKADPAAGPIGEPAVAPGGGELGDLAQRIRAMSRQFKR